MVTKVFQLLLFLSPICVGAHIDMDMFDIIFLRTGVCVLFMASLLDKPKRAMPKEVNYAVFSLLILGLWNLFVHTFAPMVLHTYLNLFLATLGLWIVYTYWEEGQSIRKAVLAAGLINLCFFIGQKLNFNPAFDKMPDLGQEGAFLGNQPRLMTYFALLTPFLPLFLVILSLGLGIYTRQYTLFLPVALMFFARMKTRKEKEGFLIVALLAAILIRKHIFGALAFRFNLAWKPAIKLFFGRPFIGYGLGAGPVEGVEVLGNSYLQFILGAGILGAAWFGYALNRIYKKFKSHLLDRESLAFFSLLGIMPIEYPIELPRVWFLVIGIIAMFLLKIYSGEKAQ